MLKFQTFSLLHFVIVIRLFIAIPLAVICVKLNFNPKILMTEFELETKEVFQFKMFNNLDWDKTKLTFFFYWLTLVNIKIDIIVKAHKNLKILKSFQAFKEALIYVWMDVLFIRIFLLKVSDRATLSSWSGVWYLYGIFDLKKHISWCGISSLFPFHRKALVWWCVISCLVLVNLEIYMCAIKRKIRDVGVIKMYSRCTISLEAFWKMCSIK